MILSWVIGCIAALLMALSRNLGTFVVGMLLYNITASVLAPMNSYISDSKGSWSDNQAFTFISASYMVGYLFGPILGGFLYDKRPELVYQVAIGLGISMLVFLLLIRRKASFLRYKAESLDVADALPTGRV